MERRKTNERNVRRKRQTTRGVAERYEVRIDEGNEARVASEWSVSRSGTVTQEMKTGPKESYRSSWVSSG